MDNLLESIEPIKEWLVENSQLLMYPLGLIVTIQIASIFADVFAKAFQGTVVFVAWFMILATLKVLTRGGFGELPANQKEQIIKQSLTSAAFATSISVLLYYAIKFLGGILKMFRGLLLVMLVGVILYVFSHFEGFRRYFDGYVKVWQ